MKKFMLSAAIALCAALCCLTACGSVSYGDLNSKLKLNYSTVHLVVTDKYDSETSLTGNYYMEFDGDRITVRYSIERFAEISLDGIPTGTKTVIPGEAVIKNGVVTSGDLDISGVLPGGLDFKEEYFENAQLTSTHFLADVKNPSGFLGTQITCTDMRVDAGFGEAFHSITVTYTSQSGNSVEYLYEFGALA